MIAKRAGALAVLVLVSGCSGLGVDNVVFVTRTDVAVDFDTSPATTALGYKRDELVLAPIDANGRVLPVLTTVGTKAAPLSFGANHSFATGDAAIVMARHLLDKEDLKNDGDGFLKYETLKKSLGKGLDGNAISASGRKRYLFTTNTSLGLE